MKSFYKILFIFFLMTTFSLAEVPSIHSIFRAVNSGDLTKAHHMIETVLRAHPRSAKAHYVAAQILIRQGDVQGAKNELQIARKIEPNLSFVKKEDVDMLEQRIDQLTHAHPKTKNSNSWIFWIILAAALLVLYLIWRNYSRRSMLSQGYPHNPNHKNQDSSPTSSNINRSSNGFFGNGFFGNILSGLAMGAGFAAGERIVDNIMDSRDSNDNLSSDQIQDNSDQEFFDSTDNDFGIDDSSSWDDGGDFDVGDDSW